MNSIDQSCGEAVYLSPAPPVNTIYTGENVNLKSILNSIGLGKNSKESVLEKLAQNSDNLEVHKGFQPNTYDFTVTNGEKKTHGVLFLNNDSWKIKKLSD